MKILVVDDQAYNRELLGNILEDYGHDIVFAENGQLACEGVAEDEEIDLVLMDVVMPEMDGLVATRNIKESLGERFLPVLFVTALDNEDGLTACLEAGGDDFVPKPVSEGILVSKVNAHRRTKSIYDKLASANKQLEYHRTMMNREHAVVEHIFKQVGSRTETYCKNLNVYTSPMSLFNGDLVMTAPTPSGGVYGMVGDFTGHGLAAAIGSLPVSEIFNQAVLNQASVSSLASDINERLEQLLPGNMFFCAAIFEIEYSGKSMTLWMGGMNDMLMIDDTDKDIIRVQSSHLPLGILSPEAFDDSPSLIDIENINRAYICTDGVIEAENPESEPYGPDRLEHIVLNKTQNTVALLVEDVRQYVGKETFDDDVSILEVISGEIVHCSNKTHEVVDIGEDYHKVESVPWDLHIFLKDKDLSSTSVVNQVMDFVSSIQGIELHQDKIFTIVSELYSNSLEHGILGLESKLKDTADGFEEYYRLRQERLESIQDQSIEIHFRYVKGDPNSVELQIHDSGQGFDIEAIKNKNADDENAHGRGLGLLFSLCSELEYQNNGTSVRAVYQLTRH